VNALQVLYGEVVYITPTVASATQVIYNFGTTQKALPRDSYGFCVIPCGAPVVPTMWTDVSEQVCMGWASLVMHLPPIIDTSQENEFR